MPRARRPRLVQHVPWPPPVRFQVVEPTPGDTYYEITLREAPPTHGYEPVFHYVAPKKGSPFTIQQLANAGAGELSEARGLVCIQDIRDGLPVFLALFASNGRWVWCVHSSDGARAQPVAPITPTEARRRFADAQQRRRSQPQKEP